MFYGTLVKKIKNKISGRKILPLKRFPTLFYKHIQKQVTIYVDLN